VRKPSSTVWLDFDKWFSPILMSSLRSLMAISSRIPDPFWVALCRLCLIDWTWHHREHQFHHYRKLEHKLLYLASRTLENLTGHLWIESPLAVTSFLPPFTTWSRVFVHTSKVELDAKKAHISQPGELVQCLMIYKSQEVL
jgi:hypothetical protein